MSVNPTPTHNQFYALKYDWILFMFLIFFCNWSTPYVRASTVGGQPVSRNRTLLNGDYTLSTNTSHMDGRAFVRDVDPVYHFAVVLQKN